MVSVVHVVDKQCNALCHVCLQQMMVLELCERRTEVCFAPRDTHFACYDWVSVISLVFIVYGSANGEY